MSTTEGGRSVIKNGLIFYLDAANTRSYVSGSTNWNDLTINGNNGILTNGPTFSSVNNGYIIFDGTNDYVDCSNLSNVQTVSYWTYITSSTNINLSACLGENIYINGVLISDILGSELITNGNFGISTTGWTVTGAISLSRIASTSGDGSIGFMRVTIASNTQYDRFSQNVGSIANQPYLISFWYQTGGVTGNFGIYLSSNISSLANQISSLNIEPSATWKYVSFIITTTSTLGYPNFSFAKQGSIGSGNLDIDAISMRPITTSYFTAGQWVNITTTSAQPFYKSHYFGMTGVGGSGGYFNGRIANVMKYSRALSASEILQNYEAQKGRFGL